jgi:hypothetical protein
VIRAERERCRQIRLRKPTGAAFASGIFFRPIRFLLIGILIFAGLTGPSEAQQAEQIKAAFIYNFAKFVQWPPAVFPAADSPLVIGVLNPGSLAGALEFLDGKVVRGKTIVIRESSTLADLKKCQIVVLSGSDLKSLGSLSQLPILTISDEAKDFFRLGGIINLITVKDHIRFEINLAAARRARLTISSQLLKLAIIVKQ